jgi:hypothetical protein
MPAQSNDRYVTGDTNWESFELLQLVGMVTERVDLNALTALAEEWRSTGGQLGDAARELGDALDRLMNFWRGTASEQARDDVARNAEWIASLGATANQIGTPIEDSAWALRAAQDQMPQFDQAVAVMLGRGSAPDGAAVGESAGGPLGAAIGATAAGTESAAAAQQAQNELKRQAVDVMRRFETAAVGIDAAIPAFEGPDAVRHAPGEPPSPRRPQPPGTPPVPPPSSTPPSWNELTGGQGTGTSSHTGAGGGSGADRGMRVGAGAPGGGGLSPTVLPGLGAGSGAGGGRLSAGSPHTGSVPTPERLANTVPAMSAGALADPDGPRGAGGAAPMGGGMAGAGAGGPGSDHRRRFPVDADDPFALEKKASPPVIGL